MPAHQHEEHAKHDKHEKHGKHDKHESHENISEELLWEIIRFNSCHMVRRRHGGAHVFSRDPLNLKNVHCRKYDGLTNHKAIGVQLGENGGVSMTTKKHDKASHPSSHHQSTTFSQKRSGRKTYANIGNSTAKQGYRSDLLPAAVARASAIRKSQTPKKDARETKSRGNKAKKEAESAKA